MPIRDAGMMEYRQLTREPAVARALLYSYPGGFAMKDRRGFTLIEILILIAIVAVMLTMATTNFFSWQQHYSAVDFQREFLSLCNQARTRAMAFNLQHRLLINMNANVESVVLQQGSSGNGYTGWGNVVPSQQIAGANGAGINDIAYASSSAPAICALVFNPDGEVLIQTDPNSTTATVLTQADVHLSAKSVADQATIRLFGWTSKARLFYGWGS
jgi:prepilin-type N-terminal cleavage/methylation domain-containing protein